MSFACRNVSGRYCVIQGSYGGDRLPVCDVAQRSLAGTDFLQTESASLMTIDSSEHPDTQDSSVSDTIQ
jgi:hypothetical protein